MNRVSKETTYRGAHGAGAAVTVHAYTYHPGTTQVATHVTHLPIAPLSRGGSGTADRVEAVFDADGFNTWNKNGGWHW